MAVYAKYVLPRLIDLAMRNKDATRLRATWVPHARGKVLEVGIGSGLNLPYYSREVQHVYGVDPSRELQRIAQRRVTSEYPSIEFLSQRAEETLPLANSSVDTVVMTWTLCSIPNAPRALEEMKRVLRAEGRLIFIEHGRAPDGGVGAWQDRLTPFWKRITGGCHLNRKIDELVTAAGFQITDLTKSYLPGPRPMTYTYQGIAQLGP
jgi:ubiquinone/menaquinone biosynthesis C-methylase UbiE